MTGPEHYKQAEGLLALTLDTGDFPPDVRCQEWRETAQVHATLALVAATIDAARFRHTPGSDFGHNWREASCD